MLPPIVQAQALVGSVAKFRPRSDAASIARSVTTPASRLMTCARTVRPSASVKARSSIPRMRSRRSVFTTTHPPRSGTAPPVRPVPAPRGIACSPSAAIAASNGCTWPSSVGSTTAAGR